jgi:DNA-binding transcriptional MerR regulator
VVQSQESWLKIGAIAARSGVSIDTVRYYERRGLLSPAPRLPSGYRLYQESTVTRIRLARRLQSLGMTLEEVADALRAHEQGGASCESERWRLESVRDRVAAKLAELTAVRVELESVLLHCAAGECELRDQPPSR